MTVRHLTAVLYDRRDMEIDADETPVRGIVHWRQIKSGETTHRSTYHHDESVARMVYTEDGRRERRVERGPRHPPELREEMHHAAETLCDLIEDLTQLEVVKVGYAPGSPIVDVWTGKEEGVDALELHHVDVPEIHEAAHAFAELVAARIATEPDQPVELLCERVGT